MKLPSLLLASTFVSGHFVLQLPSSIGFNDALEGTAPCDGFGISSRKTVTDFPTAGAPIQVLTTHPEAEWEIRAALVNDTTSFTSMVPLISQRGIGIFCLPAVPGVALWEGQQVIMQMIQHAVDGPLYQCAALRFTSGPAAGVPSSCKNATGVSASYVSSPATTTPTTTRTTAQTPGSTTASKSMATPTPSSASVHRDVAGLSCILVAACFSWHLV